MSDCVNCGDLACHLHHIVPKSLGGTDRESNLAPLCLTCHGRVHNQDFYKSKRLQKEGIAKAKAEGKYTGRKPTAMAKADEVARMYKDGFTIPEIVTSLSISRASVYRCLDKEIPTWKVDKEFSKLEFIGT